MQVILSNTSEDDSEDGDGILNDISGNSQETDSDHSQKNDSDGDSLSPTLDADILEDDYLYFEDEELDLEGLQESMEFEDTAEFYDARKLDVISF